MPVQAGTKCTTFARMSTRSIGQPSRPRSMLAAAAIASGVTLLVCLPFAPGAFGLLGLLLAAGALAVGAMACWVALPQVLVALVPILIPSPMRFYTFAWELALLALVAAMVLYGSRGRSAWLTRLGPVERALWLFTAWALFTGFWSTDPVHYFTGARRLALGACTLWVATRLPYVASRRWFD